MERTSDKHGPRADEELKEEIAQVTKGPAIEASPIAEQRERGRPETEPDPGEVAPVVDGDTPPRSLTPEEAERRENIARYLERKFPANRAEILDGARNLQAPPEVMRELEWLPDATYDGVPQIWETLGGRIEGDRHH